MVAVVKRLPHFKKLSISNLLSAGALDLLSKCHKELSLCSHLELGFHKMVHLEAAVDFLKDFGNLKTFKVYMLDNKCSLF
jgi:hypothetical protein